MKNKIFKNINLKKGGLIILISAIVLTSIILTINLPLTGFSVQRDDGAIISKDYVCEEFTEQVLWSSGYSLLSKGSMNYETWYPENNCSVLNVSDCFLGDININARFIYMNIEEIGLIGEGYIQISEPNESICHSPEKGVYLRYLAYETLDNEEVKLGKYCGKNPDTKCDEEFIGDYGSVFCYGIKVYASKYSIMDVIEIKYNLCWENES